MPNKNYIRGRAFEYRVVDKVKKMGYTTVFRSAGSHSPWDVIGILEGSPTLLVQCKTTKDKGLAKRMLERFADNPPMACDPTTFYHYQCLMVNVPTLRKTYEVFV